MNNIAIKSKYEVSTPIAFTNAVSRMFEPLTFDLAATQFNHKCDKWYGPGGIKDNSLISNWNIPGLLWLHPPIFNIKEWAYKCKIETRLQNKIALLTPASIGSNWFCEHIYQHALVLTLNPRITFNGESKQCKKDSILSLFGYPIGFKVWYWQLDLII